MAGVLNLALKLMLRAVAARQVKVAATRVLLCSAAGLLTGVFLLAALGCLLAALWIYVGHALGPVAAPAITGAALLILAGLAALLFRLPPAPAQRRAAPPDLPRELRALSDALPGLLREHAGAILAGAVLLGFFSGSRRR